MPELPTSELYRYRVHPVPREIYAYRCLLRDIAEKGIQEPVELITDGQHVALLEGHKRVEAAMELGIRSMKVIVTHRRFGPKRRFKFPLGEGMQRLLATPAAPVEDKTPPTAKPAKKSTAKPRKTPAKSRVSTRESTATVRR